MTLAEIHARILEHDRIVAEVRESVEKIEVQIARHRLFEYLVLHEKWGWLRARRFAKQHAAEFVPVFFPPNIPT